MRITVALCLVLALAAPAAFAGTAWYWGDSDTVTLDAGTGYCSLTYNSNSIDVVGNGTGYGTTGSSWVYLQDSGGSIEIPTSDTAWVCEWDVDVASSGFSGIGFGEGVEWVWTDARADYDSGQVGFYDWWDNTPIGSTSSPSSMPTHFRITRSGDTMTMEYDDGGWTEAATYTLATSQIDNAMLPYISIDAGNTYTYNFVKLSGTGIEDVNSAPAGAEGEGESEGESEGEGEGELPPPVTNGTPVAGMLGLGLVAATCALGGTITLRKK